MIYYGCGVAVAAIIAVAAGAPFIRSRGPAGLPLVVGLTLALGAMIGWALAGYETFMRATHPF